MLNVTIVDWKPAATHPKLKEELLFVPVAQRKHSIFRPSGQETHRCWPEEEQGQYHQSLYPHDQAEAELASQPSSTKVARRRDLELARVGWRELLEAWLQELSASQALVQE